MEILSFGIDCDPRGQKPAGLARRDLNAGPACANYAMEMLEGVLNQANR